MTMPFRLMAVLASGLLLLAACGGGEPEPTATSTATSTATNTATATFTPTPAATATPTFTPTPEPPPRVDISGQRIGLGSIGDIELSSDGSLILASSPQRLWLLETSDLNGEPEVFDLGTDSAASVTFSPDGSLFAAGMRSGDVQIWETATREVLTTLEGVQEEWANKVAISADNRLLASVEQKPNFIEFKPLHVLDIASGETVFSVDEVQVRDMVFSPDGTLLAGIDRRTDVVLWDAATGEELHRVQIVDDTGNGELIFSEDGAALYVFHEKRALSSLDVENPVELVDFDDELSRLPNGIALAGDNIYVSGFEATVTRFSIADNASVEQFTIADETETGWLIDGIGANGNLLMAFMPFAEKIVLYDLDKGEQIGITTISAPGVARILFDETGERMLVHHRIGGAISNQGGDALLWDISGEAPELLERFSFVSQPRFDAAGDLFGVFEENGRPTLVNLSTGETHLPPSFEYGSFYRYNPNASILTNRSEDHGTYIYNYVTEEYVQEFTGSEGDLEEIVFSPNGTHLAQIVDFSLDVWDIESGESVFQQTFGSMADVLVLTENSFWIIAGEDSNNWRLLGYEFGSDEPHTDIPVGRVEDELAISPDGRIGVVAASNALLVLYDLESGMLIEELLNDAAIGDFTFTPDGSHLAIGDSRGYVTLHPIDAP